MRLLSSSSFLLASLAVWSSSSLSTLAAPAGDGPESLSSTPPVPPRASIPQGSNDAMAKPNGHLRATNIVDIVTAPLLLPADLVKAILHAMLDPLNGKDAPKARGVPLHLVKHMVSPGKTTRTEEAAGRGEHVASQDSSMQPFASQLEASAPPAAGLQDAPVAHSHPSAHFPSLPTLRSGPLRRQEPDGDYKGSEGNSTAPLDPPVPLPVPGTCTAPGTASPTSGPGRGVRSSADISGGDGGDIVDASGSDGGGGGVDASGDGGSDGADISVGDGADVGCSG